MYMMSKAPVEVITPLEVYSKRPYQPNRLFLGSQGVELVPVNAELERIDVEVAPLTGLCLPISQKVMRIECSMSDRTDLRCQPPRYGGACGGHLIA